MNMVQLEFITLEPTYYEMRDIPNNSNSSANNNSGKRVNNNRNHSCCFENYEVYILYGFSFIGMAGLHRMYLGHYKSGFLYFFTFGLFGLGTLYDLFNLPSLIEQSKGLSLANTLSSLVEKFLRFLVTALVTLLPLHWLILVFIVGCFSMSWALAVGAVLFAYPQVMWEKRTNRPIKIWQEIKDLPIYPHLFEYFPLTLKRMCKLDPSKHYIFGYHPHGTYSLGLFAACFPKASGWTELFPNSNCVIGVASSLLCIPLCGTIFGWLGFIPASQPSLANALDQGYNVVIVPGGIAEMIEGSDPENEVVVLKCRKGFVRFAITRGCPLVPIYCFGENKSFYRYSFLKGLRLYWSRKFRITIQLFRGRWFTLIPFAVPLNVVVGEPVECKQNPDPSEDEVEQVLTEYTESLVNLYEQNKSLYGYTDKRLLVL